MLRVVRRQTINWLLLLAICELLLAVGAVFLAIYLRYFADASPLEAYSNHTVVFVRALAFGTMILLGMAALGLYQAHMRESWFGLLARQFIGFVLGVIGLIVLYYVVPSARIGRGVLGIALVLGFVSVTAFRTLFLRVVDADVLKRRVLVLGAGRRAALIDQRLRRRADRRGFVVVGFVARPGEAVLVPVERVLEAGVPLHVWAEREQIQEIVVGVDDRRGGLPMDDLLECRQLGIAVTDQTTFFERESGHVQLAQLDPSWLIFSGGFDSSPLRRLSKRSFDVGVASLLLLLGWPLLLLVTLAIRIESGAGQPILYRQERVGERGRTFWLVKFRSMRTDAEKDGVAQWASKNDDRVTRVGQICRKTRLDELPQMWNVFKGDMSFIGPRLERPQFVAELAQQIRYYNLRHCVKPGLAGWAQLRYPYGASTKDATEKLKYDLFYVKNHNLLFDLAILIQTVEIVLFGRGAR